jgi:cytochrome c biogenesis protein CcmG, thiol:disulfide interchange protein DsbE
MASAAKLAAQALAVAAVVGLFALLVWKVTHQPGSGVEKALAAGKHPPAPLFTLSRLDGPGRLSLASLRGKAVVVNFWASWCAPCKSELPVLEKSWQQYRNQGLVVLGVDAWDGTSDAKRFARKYGITYPIVHDAPGSVVDRYGVTGFPETFFVDRSGKLVGAHISGSILSTREITAQYEASIRRALQS